MKKHLCKTQHREKNSYMYQNTIGEDNCYNDFDRSVLFFQWCTGKSIARIAKENRIPYHKVYRCLRNG